jgi:hypothetical protein
MTIKATIAALQTKLKAVDPATVDSTTDQIPLAVIYTDPKEAVNLSEFPLAILYLAPQTQHSIMQEAVSYAVDHYTIRIQLFLGDRNTGLEELHQRVLPWPRAIATTLLADLTLGGAVQYIGSSSPGANEDGKFFDYNYGPKQWGDSMYFGYTIDLPVCEWFQTRMG